MAFRWMVGALFLAACTAAGPTIQVRSDRTTYEVGGRVVVTIRNGTRDTLWLQTCRSRVQHRSDRLTWIANFARSCDGDGDSRQGTRPIPPGTSGGDTLLVGSNADAGLGRVQLRLRNSEGRVLDDTLSVSNTFDIRTRRP